MNNTKILIASVLSALTFNANAVHSEDDINKVLTSDLDKCFIAAHKKYGGNIVSLEREVDDGRGVYELDINTKDGREIEVECVIGTTELIDEEIEVKKDDDAFNNAVKVSAEEAEKIALENTPGKVVEREYAFEGDLPVYEFDIYSESIGHEVEVEINGVTGEIMETEIEIYDIGVDS